jgi:hypothetical protein
MRERQPDAANLLPSGRDVVDEAARNHQVRPRIVMAENDSGPGKNHPGGAPCHDGGAGKQPFEADYNHVPLR